MTTSSEETGIGLLDLPQDIIDTILCKVDNKDLLEVSSGYDHVHNRMHEHMITRFFKLGAYVHLPCVLQWGLRHAKVTRAQLLMEEFED